MKHKIIPILVAGGIFTSLGSSFARAENLDFTASVTVEPTSCTIEQLDDGKLRYDFGEVSPRQLMEDNLSRESSFNVKGCIGTKDGYIDLTLVSDNTVTLTGDNAGTWVIPAPGEGKAAGMAYQTDMKYDNRAYASFPVDTPKQVSTSITLDTIVSIRATLIPTVATAKLLTPGNMDTTATVQISYR